MVGTRLRLRSLLSCLLGFASDIFLLFELFFLPPRTCRTYLVLSGPALNHCSPPGVWHCQTRILPFEAPVPSLLASFGSRFHHSAVSSWARTRHAKDQCRADRESKDPPSSQPSTVLFYLQHHLFSL
ncbi:hypothetical protein VTK56DRAFT_5405 [Thermocarpiscus australiensis]